MVVINIFCILIIVAFYTLMERKILASIQRRTGPAYTGYNGILQPFADRVKLIFKEIIIPNNSFKKLFLFAPFLNLLIRIFLWLFIPFNNNRILYHPFSLYLIYIISSLNIYRLVFAGWSGQSRYSLMAAIRSVAQMLAYELPLSICFLTVILINKTRNIVRIKQTNTIYLILPIRIICLICLFAETNRTPFDLPEAEAELVAGYNVEYSGIIFAFFFIREYSNILFSVSLFCILFFGKVTIFKWLFFRILFIFIRGILPRFRFDQLLYFRWAVLLPISFSLFFFYLNLIFLLDLNKVFFYL